MVNSFSRENQNGQGNEDVINIHPVILEYIMEDNNSWENSWNIFLEYFNAAKQRYNENDHYNVRIHLTYTDDHGVLKLTSFPLSTPL